MKGTCTIRPKLGRAQMDELRKRFGYATAREIMLKGALNPKFINDYRTSLVFDASGVPTVESLLSIPVVRNKFIGKDRLLKTLNNDRPPLEDTIVNYETLLQEAFEFNTKSPYRDSFVAQVGYTEDNKIKVVIADRTDDGLKAFQNAYRQNQLNKKLADIFKALGVTVGTLSKVEVEAGRVGVTDFTIADRLAKDFVSMIRVANNKEGAEAISEEFAHLIIGSMKDNPLIQRALNFIKSNPKLAQEILGDDYEDVSTAYNEDMDLIAEEALGHILEDNLLQTNTDIVLFGRTADNIRSQFKKYKDSDVLEAIKEVNETMSQVAKSILDNTLPITREQIINSRRQAQLNALSDRVKRNLDILQKARETEVKRYRIGSGYQKEFAATNIDIIESAPISPEDELGSYITILKYSQSALEEMKDKFAIISTLGTSTTSQTFAELREIRSFVQSYGKFIRAVREALLDDSTEEDSLVANNNATIQSLKEVIKELNDLSEDITTKYTKTAFASFCEFVKPYLGDNTVLKMKGPKGTEITVEELLTHADKDISFLDRWLDSMGNSSDVALQVFDQIVKQTKDSAKDRMMGMIRRIIALRQEAESKGITSFEWMFEKSATGRMSGDYIDRLNYAEFRRQMRAFEKSLDEKYGKNPRGDKATEKIDEWNKWLTENAVSPLGVPVPKDIPKWQNKAYQDLSVAQKEILDKFMAIKDEMEELLPEDKRNSRRAIQMSKTLSQRLIDSGLSPSTIFTNLKNYYSETFIDRIDDDQIFGQSSRGGMRDFEGHEYMTLPILYINRIENPNDLSTDVFSALMSYSYMAMQFAAMSDVIDALEVGRTIMKKREVTETRGGFPVAEKVKTAVGEATGLITKDKSNIEQKLDDFFESQIYGRYLKDSGALNILGTPINKNKLVSWILNRSSMAQLGFNWLANTANLLTGSCMQHIEAVASEHFNPKELMKADAEYFKMLTEFVPELGARFKQSKLALFDELINFKGEFKKNLAGVQRRNVLQRLFGENIAFIGQEGGDHWLYNRTAIAMAMRQRVIVPGKGEMSLWEALEIVDSQYGQGLKQMILPKDTTDLEGKKFNLSQWSRKVLDVNQKLFGIYNDDDANAANRVIMGRLLQQYRKWIKPQYNKRFQAAQQNLALGQVEEGYYRTLARLVKEVVRGQVQLSALSNELTDHEKANLKRCLVEFIQWLAVYGLVNWVDWPDDKNRPWAMKYAEYAATRLAHELGGLAPSPTLVDEMLKNVKNPVPSIGVLVDLNNFIRSAFTPSDYFDELQSGPYKGMSTFEKNFMKAPFYGIRQYKQIQKFTKELDNSILYYTRPY